MLKSLHHPLFIVKCRGRLCSPRACKGHVCHRRKQTFCSTPGKNCLLMLLQGEAHPGPERLATVLKELSQVLRLLGSTNSTELPPG